MYSAYVEFLSIFSCLMWFRFFFWPHKSDIHTLPTRRTPALILHTSRGVKPISLNTHLSLHICDLAFENYIFNIYFYRLFLGERTDETQH